jgi:putative endopeptidase
LTGGPVADSSNHAKARNSRTEAVPAFFAHFAPSRKRWLALALACGTSLAAAHGNEHGLDARNFDISAGACRDFFRYANGGWLKANPIPAAYSQWSLDDEITERNDAILRKVLEDAAAHPAESGSAAQKVGDFYSAAMDEAAIEKAGVDPLRADLGAIAAMKVVEDVSGLIAQWQQRGDAVLFDLEAQPDLKNSAIDIAYAGQGGLGLPDRDYYLRADAKSRRLLDDYRGYVARLLALLGDPNAKEEAGWVIELETRFAKASLDRVALRDPEKSYHIVSLDEAQNTTPHFSWSGFFHNAARGDPGSSPGQVVQRFSLAQPDFFAAADAALAQVPVAHWQAWLRWRLADASAPYLDKRFTAAHFDFHGRTLRGAREQKPRWKRALESADGAIGELLGEQYVARVFPPQAKQRAIALVENLKGALRERIEHLAWMSADTKHAALAKLDTLVAKIGYPERWRDYSRLTISRASWLGNMRAAAAFEAQRQFAKFDRPVDRGEWDMTPQTVNAYYNPMRNEIVFPAAQLLPPYFDADADDALNYGAIGSVIGHEMTHGFDDEGSRFDAHGNLVDWWSAADRAEFERRAAQLVGQFNAYVPIDDLHINGQLTLGENIADLGGLLVAYDAFKRTAQGRDGKAIDGFAPDQRFFLAYAQAWRTSQRPAQLRLQVRSNEHAPAKFRVNGPLGDVPAFAHAFDCKPGDPLRPASGDIVDIW